MTCDGTVGRSEATKSSPSAALAMRPILLAHATATTRLGRRRRSRSPKNQHGPLLAIGFVLWLRSGKISGTTRNHGRTLMLEHAKYWRSRAEEARVLAELLEDVQSKQIMLGIAGDYGRMAELAEQRVKSGGLPSAPWPG
jgi:hypothetical protein